MILRFQIKLLSLHHQKELIMKKKKDSFSQAESDAKRLLADPAAKGIAQNVLDYIQRHRSDD